MHPLICTDKALWLLPLSFGYFTAIFSFSNSQPPHIKCCLKFFDPNWKRSFILTSSFCMAAPIFVFTFFLKLKKFLLLAIILHSSIFWAPKTQFSWLFFPVLCQESHLISVKHFWFFCSQMTIGKAVHYKQINLNKNSFISPILFKL